MAHKNEANCYVVDSADGELKVDVTESNALVSLLKPRDKSCKGFYILKCGDKDITLDACKTKIIECGKSGDYAIIDDSVLLFFDGCDWKIKNSTKNNQH